MARELKRTVAELRATISQAEILHWYMFFQLEKQQEELYRLKAEGRSHAG